MTDEHLIDGSRDYDCCRYFDLIQRIEEFYADGKITPAELNRMKDMRGETLINYQVAIKLKETMDPKAPDYGKLGELIDYLRRCWQVMDQAYDRGVQANQQNPETNEASPKKLSLHVNKEKADLLASVLPPRHGETEYESLSPAEKEKATLRVVRALKYMEEDKMRDILSRLRTLEHTEK